MSSSGRRTRGGCLNCKKRKRKCDEQRPECMACKERNVPCGGYAHPVRWVEGMASRGRFVGVRDPGKLSQSATGTTTAAARMNDHDSATSTLPVRNRDRTSLNSPAVPVSSTVADQDVISEEERLAFSKFLSEGLHRLCNAEVYSWLSVFFENASQESKALALVGAALQTFYDNGWTVTAMERMDHAIRTFRTDLERLGGERRSATICSGLLICTMCLYQNRPITPYLRLLADMHDLNGSLAGLQPNPRANIPSQHVLEVLGVMDIPSFLVGRLNPSLGIWKRVRNLRSEESNQVLGEVEAVTGMPRNLLDIFGEMTDQGEENKDVEALFWSWPGCVGSYDQCHLWDTWRYAGILDARRRARGQNSTATSPASTASSILDYCSSNEAVLCRLMASLDALVRKVKITGELEPIFLNKGLQFPYTLASLELPLLRANPRWKSTLQECYSVFFANEEFIGDIVFKLLDEAWESGANSFDIDHAARELGVEQFEGLLFLTLIATIATGQGTS